MEAELEAVLGRQRYMAGVARPPAIATAGGTVVKVRLDRKAAAIRSPTILRPSRNGGPYKLETQIVNA